MSVQKNSHDVRTHLKKQFGLSTEQIDALMPSFLNALAGYLDELAHHFGAGNREAVGRVAHTTKGALLNLGLDEQADLAKNIELQAKAGADLGDMAADYERLKTELGSVLG